MALPSRNVIITVICGLAVAGALVLLRRAEDANRTITSSPQAQQAAEQAASANTPQLEACQQAQLGEVPEAPISPGNPGLTSQESIVYYDIAGRDEAALRQQLADCAPRSSKGAGVAFTANRITWQYLFNTAPGFSCRIGEAAVGLNIVQHFPRWVPPADTSPELVGKWENFLQNLQTHEDEHVALARTSAETILTKLQQLPPAVSCDELTATAENLAQQELDNLAAKNRAYDETTGNGATQGAIFP